MIRKISRRSMLKTSAQAALSVGFFPSFASAQEQFGAVIGEPTAAKVGETFLRNGANAVDAAVAAALTAAIASPGKCGIGGYGGHAIIGLASGKVVAIDFNSTAPAAAKPDMYPLDESGKVKDKLNVFGWLAAGVPGTLAGLQLALNRYGTRSFRDVVGPAIDLCEEGVQVRVETGTQASINSSNNDARPESLANQTAPKQKNLPLGKLLRTLAERNSVDSFYRGDIAKIIAAAFLKNGGLVTERDLAHYTPLEVKPLSFTWNSATIHTPPLTAAGIICLEALSILKAVDWARLPEQQRFHAKLEALRIAWADRFDYFGDPAQVSVPVKKLLSSRYASERAREVMQALKSQEPVPLKVDAYSETGTVNISASDSQGNMVAITLTHGSGYGARVSVEELGMVLGHGMSRFDPRPGKPNSVAPGKRPVNNMCPSLVTRSGKPVLTLGGAGGTRIPCSVYEVLAHYVGRSASLETAINEPRVHNIGDLQLKVEKEGFDQHGAFLKKLGYTATPGPSAFVTAVEFDRKQKQSKALARGGSY